LYNLSIGQSISFVNSPITVNVNFTSESKKSAVKDDVCNVRDDKRHPPKTVDPAKEQKRLSDMGVLTFLRERLAKVPWLVKEDDDGKLSLVSGTTRGNRADAHRRSAKTASAVEKVIDDKPNHCTFATLTIAPDKAATVEDTWKYAQKTLPAYICHLRRKGMLSYVWVREAHLSGRCHIHLLCRWKLAVQKTSINGKPRVDTPEVYDAIKGWKGGHSDLLALDSDNQTRLAGYLTKELGKFSHFEDSLRRARQGWKGEGEAKRCKSDVQRLLTYYHAISSGCRLYGAGGQKADASASASPAGATTTPGVSTSSPRLDTNSNNPSDGILYFPIPLTLLNHLELVSGPLKPGTKAYDLVKRHIDRIKRWHFGLT